MHYNFTGFPKSERNMVYLGQVIFQIELSPMFFNIDDNSDFLSYPLLVTRKYEN